MPPLSDKHISDNSSHQPSLVIIIGQAGSGHSTALDCLADAGYTAVDNLPLALVDQLIALTVETDNKRLAICADIRTSGFDLKAVGRLIKNLKNRLSMDCRIVLTHAHPDEILRRYQNTRRRHPLASSEADLETAIAKDQNAVTSLPQLADIDIDSTHLTPNEFKQMLLVQLGLASDHQAQLNIMSFSYRRGLPAAADFIFDMRFLQNPHWDENLRILSGLDHEVADFIIADKKFLPFMQTVTTMMNTALPDLKKDGRAQLTICFGCTGGQHRSVASAKWLFDWATTEQIAARISHRELN